MLLQLLSDREDDLLPCVTKPLQYIVTEHCNIPLPEHILFAEPYNRENRPVLKSAEMRLSMMRSSKKDKLLDKKLPTIFLLYKQVLFVIIRALWQCTLAIVPTNVLRGTSAFLK